MGNRHGGSLGRITAVGVMGLGIVVLASGRGSNFAAIADAALGGQLPNVKILGLVCNKPDAPVIALARARQIPVHIVDYSRFRPNRSAYEVELLKTIETLRPHLICLAGYMLLLGPEIIGRYAGKIINIHPSLLPSFKGLNAQKQALDHGVKWTGCTVHYVTQEMDAGPIIAQTPMEILPGDSEETLTRRLLSIEHSTYVDALKSLSNQK